MFVLKSTYEALQSAYETAMQSREFYMDRCNKLINENNDLKEKLTDHISPDLYSSVVKDQESALDELEDLRDTLRAVRDYLIHHVPLETNVPVVKTELDCPKKDG